MTEQVGAKTVDTIDVTLQDKLRCHIEELLKDLQLPPLTNDEWASIQQFLPKRYWELVSELVGEVRGACDFANADPALRDDLQDNIEALMKALDLPSLTDEERSRISTGYFDRYWKFVNALIAEARGNQHIHDVEAAIARERAKDEMFDELVWSITRRNVQQFCRDNDEALSDEEMEELFYLLHDYFDQYEIIGEAIDRLRNGTHWSTQLSSTAEMSVAA